METGKKRLSGGIVREASTDEVKCLRRESRDLKECVADITLENRLLKKNMTGDVRTADIRRCNISKLRKWCYDAYRMHLDFINRCDLKFAFISRLFNSDCANHLPPPPFPLWVP